MSRRFLDARHAAGRLARWVALGAASGVLAGVASFLLLEALDAATDLRLDHPWLLWLLPAAGAAIGYVHHRWGGRAVAGNALLLEEIHRPTSWVPRRMAPLVFGGTAVAHVFGGSVGREGTALQVSGSLTDLLARRVGLGPADRRVLLVAAIAGGFGSVFGVPLTGIVFALEVQAIGRLRLEALAPTITAAFVGDLVVGALGGKHTAWPRLDLPFELGGLVRIAVAGIAFGLAARAFTALVHGVRSWSARRLPWPPARLAVGGLATIALVALAGRDYLGLSLPLLDETLAGHDPATGAFALKLLFTVVALGFGFPGGEVTPLFVIGATLGGALAGPLGGDVATLGSVGFVAVFAGAANTPLAGAVLGAEIFGSGSLLAMAIGCVVAYACSSHRGIYGTGRPPA